LASFWSDLDRFRRTKLLGLNTMRSQYTYQQEAFLNTEFRSSSDQLYCNTENRFRSSFIDSVSRRLAVLPSQHLTSSLRWEAFVSRCDNNADMFFVLVLRVTTQVGDRVANADGALSSHHQKARG